MIQNVMAELAGRDYEKDGLNCKPSLKVMILIYECDQETGKSGLFFIMKAALQAR